MAKSKTEQRLIEATQRFLATRGDDEHSIDLDDAVCQDLLIFGVDVDDYVGVLDEEFGPVVWTIPWAHFTDQTSSFRGCGCLLLPPWLVGQFARKAIRGGPVIPGADPRHHPYRLTLREAAAAIEAGGWPDDWQPE